LKENLAKYCIKCGTPTKIQSIFGSEHPVCPSCGWIYFEDPKVAVAALIEQGDQLLLARRIFPPFKGYWTLPAGFMNAHEIPADAAKRECLEETGLEIAIKELVNVFGGREHPNGADIFIVYRAEITGGALHAGDDVDQVAFFSRDHLPPLAFSSIRKILGIPG
jgi:ADP-ribose pyrophosphatase YjhB (NUDIX family)